MLLKAIPQRAREEMISGKKSTFFLFWRHVKLPDKKLILGNLEQPSEAGTVKFAQVGPMARKRLDVEQVAHIERRGNNAAANNKEGKVKKLEGMSKAEGQADAKGEGKGKRKKDERRSCTLSFFSLMRAVAKENSALGSMPLDVLTKASVKVMKLTRVGWHGRRGLVDSGATHAPRGRRPRKKIEM